MADARLMELGGDAEMAGAKESTLPPRSAPSARWGLRRVLVAASAVAALAAGACLLLRPTGAPAPEVADVDSMEELQDDNACAEYPYLKFVDVKHSNLGGHGPDSGPEGIVYTTEMRGEAAGDDVGEHVLLEVNAIGSYHPAAPGANGMQGEYGSVNLLHGSKVDMVFQIKHAKTGKPLTIPHAALTFFDLDEGPDGKCQESVTVGGFTDIIVTDDTEVIQEKEDDGRTAFKASEEGTGADNPKDPMFLTKLQKNRAVSLIFQEFQKHKVTLAAAPGQTPRFFTFVMRPSLLCAATVQEGYVPTTTTPPPKYPPLKLGAPVGEQFVVAPPGKRFVKWMVGMNQRVQVGESIAVLAPGHEVVKAKHAGMVVAKSPLKAGEKLEGRMVDHNIAVLDERLPPLPFDPDAGEDGEYAKRKLHFVRWLKEVGDPVTEGTPIAQVSTGNPLHMHLQEQFKIKKMKPEMMMPKGGWSNIMGTVTGVPATDDGFIMSQEPFVLGDVIGEVKQNKNGEAIIAVISESKGSLLWLWLLLGALATTAILAMIIFFLMAPEKKKETYKPVPAAQEAPPPPPPAPWFEPAGLRLDFDDHKGNIKTIYATMRPLGIANEDKAPIDVTDLTFNSYAASMGVQKGWTIVQVGKTDVRGKTDYKEVKGLIDYGLKSYPCYPLKMDLVNSATSEKKTFEFACRPLGFEFDNLAPIKVKRVYPNSYALSLNMKDFVKDSETWVLCKVAEEDLPESNHNFPKIFEMLKAGTKALDPYTEEDGKKSEDQLKGWD